MRSTTKRKVWGRNSTVAAIRGTIQDLERALKVPDKVDVDAVTHALEHLKWAAECMGVYKQETARLQKAIKRELGHLELLMKQANGEAITPQEKLITRAQRKKKTSEKRAVSK